MIRLKVIEIITSRALFPSTSAKAVGSVEEFIATIGYDNIKNIIVTSPNATSTCYSIFYEDGQPYIPSPTSEKKGFWGF